jgi:hypothetical protein
VSRASDGASVKPQQVTKASRTQSNNLPQAAPNVTTTANKPETSRTTANNSVSVAKASKPPAPKKNLKSIPSKLKPDSVAITTDNGSHSGDEDQKEREEMLASPVKGSDAQSASTVSRILLFECIFTSLPLCKAIIKLEKTNEKPKNSSRSKAELLQLGGEDLVTWKNVLEPNYIKYYLSTKTLWSADAKLLEIAQLLYNETLGSKKPLLLTQSSGPIKLVMHLLLLLRSSLTFSQLNQKLNEVRNQTGKIAITNLDASFLEEHDSLEDHTPKSVANMRIKFAQDLLEGYRFLFGPNVELEDGSVCYLNFFLQSTSIVLIIMIIDHEGKAIL